MRNKQEVDTKMLKTGEFSQISIDGHFVMRGRPRVDGDITIRETNSEVVYRRIVVMGSMQMRELAWLCNEIAEHLESHGR